MDRTREGNTEKNEEREREEGKGREVKRERGKEIPTHTYRKSKGNLR